MSNSSLDLDKNCHYNNESILLQDDDLVPNAVVLLDTAGENRKAIEYSVGGLVWSNLSVTSAVSSTNSTFLLHPFSGSLANGCVCGILGPSGAGKTTFLTALARGPFSGRLSEQGSVWRYHDENEHSDDKNIVLDPVEPNQIAWLQQRSAFFSRLTVRETLELAAFFELSGSIERSKSRRGRQKEKVTASFSSARVTYLLERLSLLHAAHRPTYQLSGGERRRLAIALEFLSLDKRLLLADEPTSGLDSTMSVQVLKLIGQLCEDQNIPCFVTLHQPRSLIWNTLLDYVVLMASNGRVVYFGKKKDALTYFADLGYSCPPATNPAEFLVDLVSINTEDNEQAQWDESRIRRLTTKFEEHQRKTLNEHNEFHPLKRVHVAVDIPLIQSRQSQRFITWPRPLASFLRFAALLKRSWRQNFRNGIINFFRLFFGVGNAVLLASIFPTVAPNQPVRANSLADRVALLSFAAINMAMMAYMKTIHLFAQEKPVVNREQQRHDYTAAEYLLAKSLAELPFDACFAVAFTTVLKWCSGLVISWDMLTAAFSVLNMTAATLGFAIGSWVPIQDLAMTAGIPVVVMLMVVGIINPSGVDAASKANTPLPIQILKQLSPFRFCIEALCLGEYTGMEFASDHLVVSQSHRRGPLSWLRAWWGRFSNLPRMGAMAFVRNGDQVIDALGLQNQTYRGALIQLAILIAGNLFISWLGLMFHQHRHQWYLRSRTPITQQHQRSNAQLTSSKELTDDNSHVAFKARL